MEPLIKLLILHVFVFISHCESLATPGFLRAAIIPRYFDGVLNNNGNVSKALPLPNLSQECDGAFSQFLSQLRDNYEDISKAENWALKMADSWGKGAEGILSGHVTAMGDFDECLSIDEGVKVRGKYCTTYMLWGTGTGNSTKGPETLNHQVVQDMRSLAGLEEMLIVLGRSSHAVRPSIANCVPASCSDTDVQKLISWIFSSSPIFNSSVLVLGKCYTAEKPPLSTGAWVMIGVLLILAFLCLSGSVMDVIQNLLPQEKFRPLLKVLLAFSVFRNGKKLLSTEVSPNAFNCLHGLRFLSALWVVLGHTFFMYILSNTWNIVDLVQAVSSSPFFLLIVNGGVVVDTFLTMTGILVSFNVLKQLELRRGKLNFLLLYLKRWLRLTPMYALLIGVSATIFPYFGSGPKWETIEYWSAFCQRNWWHNLLYINNLNIYDAEESPSTNKQCFGEAWYLAVDMQLFLISPFLLFPLWKWRRVGLVLLSGVTAASILTPGIVTYVNNFPPTALPFVPRGDFTNQAYMVPWMRAAPYIMGLWTGYILFLTRKSRISIPKPLSLLSWALMIASGLAVVTGVPSYFDYHFKIPRLEGAIYAGAYHAVWGVFISWIVFACVKGHGGFIAVFLEWKAFVPLGRLTYAIYLTSLNLQFFLHYGMRQPAYYGLWPAINMAFSHILASILVSFFVTIVMESPFMELEKLVFKQGDRAKVGFEDSDRLRQSNGQEQIVRNYGAVSE